MNIRTYWQRLPRFARLAAIPVLAGAAVALLAGQLLTGPVGFTAHGSAQVCDSAPDVTDGGQVTVTDAAGHVLGSGTLAADNSPAAAKAEQAYGSQQTALGTFGNSAGLSLYTFTVPGLPGGLARYGVSMGQNRGTVWLSPEEARRPSLNLGC